MTRKAYARARKPSAWPWVSGRKARVLGWAISEPARSYLCLKLHSACTVDRVIFDASYVSCMLCIGTYQERGGMTRKVTQWLVALLLAAVAVGVPLNSSAAASVNGREQIGFCWARGDFATCSASGSINKPLQVSVGIFTLPENLSVTVYWSTVCSEGSGAGSRSGHFTRNTPKIWILQLPYSRPDSCDVAASAGVNGNSTRLRVYLYATQS